MPAAGSIADCREWLWRRLGHNDAAARLGCKSIKCVFEFSGVVNGMSNVFTPKADAAALKADMLSPAAGLVRSNSA